MPTLPPLVTPIAESEATCPECGSTLIRTGKPATFSDGTGERGRGATAKPHRGWVPSLLVTICPVCDARPELAVETPTEPEEQAAVAAIKESYLERLGREADERAAKEADDAS